MSSRGEALVAEFVPMRDVEAVAIADFAMNRLAAVGERFDVPYRHVDADELLEHELDLISVCRMPVCGPAGRSVPGDDLRHLCAELAVKSRPVAGDQRAGGSGTNLMVDFGQADAGTDADFDPSATTCDGYAADSLWSRHGSELHAAWRVLSAGGRGFSHAPRAAGGTGSRIGRGHEYKQHTMNQVATVTMETSKIHEQKGFNVRTHRDEGSLDRPLGEHRPRRRPRASSRQGGRKGEATVIAGHHRLAAARQAGVEQVAVVFYEGDRDRQVSLVENIHPEDLDPIDAARGLKAIAEEFDLTKQQLAEQLDMSVTWVSERLRLLALPEGAQELIAAGTVPVEAERVLRKVAEVSTGRRVRLHHGEAPRRQALGLRPRLRPAAATYLRGSFHREAHDDRRVPDEGQQGALRPQGAGGDDRADQCRDRYLVSEGPQVRIGEPEVDAARAAGCLIEHEVDNEGFVSVAACITDAELAADPAPTWGRSPGGRCEEASRGRGGPALAQRPDGRHPEEQRTRVRRSGSRPRPMPRPLAEASDPQATWPARAETIAPSSLPTTARPPAGRVRVRNPTAHPGFVLTAISSLQHRGC